MAGGFPGEAWDRPPAPGGSSQPGGQGEGGEAARSAAAGSSGFSCRKHSPGAVAVSQAARVAGAQGPPRSRRTARGRPQQPGRPLALLFSARRLSIPLYHSNAVREICQQLSRRVSSALPNFARCCRQQGRRRAPHGLDRGSAAAGRQLAACRDGRLSQIVTMVRVGHLAANLGAMPPAPLALASPWGLGVAWG